MMAFLMLMRTGFLVLMAAALPIAGGGWRYEDRLPGLRQDDRLDDRLAPGQACGCLRHWLLGDAVPQGDTDDLEPRQRGTR
ncbi:hypothetical protein GS539_23000 [Rhodococcus hoagii]|nr:hypothetical protein [Prescottella equi]